MRRRDFLQLLVSGAIGSHIDVDRLLWEPNRITYFLPSVRVASYSEIIALEMERILPHLKNVFERDDMFYRALTIDKVNTISGGTMRVPLRAGMKVDIFDGKKKLS